jgi:hypothetical protein
VVEVLAAELTLSPHHTAGWGVLKENAGAGAAVPRFTGRWRHDKTPEDATTVTEAVGMYRTARRITADASCGTTEGPSHSLDLPVVNLCPCNALSMSS